MKTRITAALLACMLFVLPLYSGFAQETGSATSGTGSIDALMQDDNYIVINGTRFAFREAEAVISYNGRQIRSVSLSPGQRVSYRTRSDGSISAITVIGSYPDLDAIDNQ